MCIVQDMKRNDLTGIPGNGVTSDPEAMRMFLVVIISFEPSAFVTVTSLGPVIEAVP